MENNLNRKPSKKATTNNNHQESSSTETSNNNNNNNNNKKKLIQYLPFNTFIDSTFWFEIKRLKLDDLRLDVRPININPSCSLRAINPGMVTLDYESFASYETLDAERENNPDYDGFMLNGKLIIYNTKEEFLQADKRALINHEGQSIWESMLDETRQKHFDENLEYYLARFFMIVYGDFKNYDFYFWCAYPSLSFPPNCFQSIEQKPQWTNNFTLKQSKQLIKSMAKLSLKQRVFFVIILKNPSNQNRLLDGGKQNGERNKSSSSSSSSSSSKRAAVYFKNYNQLELMLFDQFWSMETFEMLATTNNKDTRILFAFSDYSDYPNYPGWLLRNYLSYIHVRLSQMLRKHPKHSNLLAMVQNILYRDHLTMVALSIARQQVEQLAQPQPSSSSSSSSSLSELKQSDLDTVFKCSFVHRVALLPSNHKQIKPKSYLDEFIKDVQKLYGWNVDNNVTDNGSNHVDGKFSTASSSSSSSSSSTTTTTTKTSSTLRKSSSEKFVPPAVGWERNKEMNNRVIYSQVNCAETLNPEKMAMDALHLNLKLMKWRLAKDLDLNRVKDTKCLLLGAGTLGCNVARLLVAWGVHHITMVDNKCVSYSNPARQTLFTYKDAVDGAKPKSVAAVESLKMINPGLNAQGVQLSIKMPGHPFKKPAEQEFKEIEKLEQLIHEHDVVFLMTDTRESRWLPTLIATSQHKIIINVALGFDSFLVQRFGVRIRPDNRFDRKSHIYPLYRRQMDVHDCLFPSLVTESPFLLGTQIGCYFCQDITGPSDSTKDRTLDQQCTVARPGVSMIASGYAVELLVTLLQHSAGPLAPALLPGEDATIMHRLKELNMVDVDLLSNDSMLGLVVPQIRGFLTQFIELTACSSKLECCTACSFAVIDRYRNDRENFLHQAINQCKFLETFTGIEKFQNPKFDLISFDSGDDDIDINDG